MDRTQGANYTTDTLTGKRQFTDGPPGTAVEKTFLNGVQDEICNVIEQAGLTPDSADNTQLFAALGKWKTIARNSADFFSDGGATWGVPTNGYATNKYIVLGDTLILTFRFVLGSVVSAAGGTSVLHMRLPNSYLAVGQGYAPIVTINAGAPAFGYYGFLSNQSTINFYTGAAAVNWATTTNGQEIGGTAIMQVAKP